jgi:hypothetical protein
MNVGILTFHTADNYGAVLQAWSLKSVVGAMSHHVQVIDYRPRRAERRYLFNLLIRPSFGALIRYRLVHKYIRQHLNLTRTVVDLERLKTVTAGFDAVIVGSDEVWAVKRFRPFDPAFYLGYLPAGIRRISYAPSRGSSAETRVSDPRVGPWLSQLDALSVRDEPTGQWVESLTAREPVQVLDPTLLANPQPQQSVPILDTGYLAVYGRPAPLECTQIRAIADRLGLAIVSIGMRNAFADINRAGIGPDEWMAWMRGARMIVTTYFHGIAFAIIYRKSFYAIYRSGKKEKIQGLLDSIGIEKRCLEDSLDATADEMFLDYSHLETQLANQRRHSWEYLQEALHG